MTSPTPPRVSVIIVADGPWDDTYRCLTAVARGAAGVAHEVLVVDDGTTDETRQALPLMEGVTVLRGEVPQGFHAAAAAGLGEAHAPLAVLLHADAEPHPGWLEPLVRLAEADPAVAAVASRVLAPSGLLEGDGVVFGYAVPYPMTPLAHAAGEPGIPSSEVSQVPAAPAVSLLLRRDRFAAIDGFDPSFDGPAADLDLCLRLAAAGGVVLVARASVVVHHGRCSAEISDADASFLTRRWLGRLPLLDPAGRAGGPSPRQVTGRGPVSVVIPVGNGLATIAPCVASVLRNLGAGDELVLADAGSKDGSMDFARLLASEHRGTVRIVEAGAAAGEAEALRRGLEVANRPDVLLVRQTLELPEGFITQLASLRPRPVPSSAVAVSLPGAGLCVLAVRPLLGALAERAPGACLGSDAASLGVALQALGGTMALVPLGAAAA